MQLWKILIFFKLWSSKKLQHQHSSTWTQQWCSDKFQNQCWEACTLILAALMDIIIAVSNSISYDICQNKSIKTRLFCSKSSGRANRFLDQHLKYLKSKVSNRQMVSVGRPKIARPYPVLKFQHFVSRYLGSGTHPRTRNSSVGVIFSNNLGFGSEPSCSPGLSP